MRRSSRIPCPDWTKTAIRLSGHVWRASGHRRCRPAGPRRGPATRSGHPGRDGRIAPCTCAAGPVPSPTVPSTARPVRQPSGAEGNRSALPAARTLPGTWRRSRPAPAAEKQPGKPLAQGTEYGLARWARCGLQVHACRWRLWLLPELRDRTACGRCPCGCGELTGCGASGGAGDSRREFAVSGRA
jgi:hypothetical protein